MRTVTVALLGVALLASVAQAGVLPTATNQKWEASLDGFSKITQTPGPDGILNTADDVWKANNLTKIDSPLKGQGDITTANDEPPGAPDKFFIGYDNGPSGRLQNAAPDVHLSSPSVLGMLITGLKLIAVDDNLIGQAYAAGPAQWNRLTDGAQFAAWQSAPGVGAGVGPYDILYFGAEDPAVPPRAYVYFDTDNSFNDFGMGGTWNAAGDMYTDGGKTFGNDGSDLLVLELALQDLGFAQVDGLSRSAPAGTFIANVNDPWGSIRPLVFFDAVGGPDSGSILPDGMWSSLTYDPDGDGDMLTNGSQFTSPQIADLIGAIASQAVTAGPLYVPADGQPGETWASLSDPIEWVSIPEPGMLAIWGVLGLIGLVLYRRRR